MPLPHVDPMTLKPGEAFAYGNFVFLLGGAYGPQPSGEGLLGIVAVDTVSPGLPYQQLTIRDDDVFPVPVLKTSNGVDVHTYGVLVQTAEGFSRVFKVVITTDGLSMNKLYAYSLPIVVRGTPTEEEAEETARIFKDNPPIEDGDIVVIGAEAYTVNVLGQETPCAEFIRGIHP